MAAICSVHNFPQKYREPIFRQMDNEWDIEWYFGKNDTDIKEFDKGLLKKEHYINTIFFAHKLRWQAGTGCLMRKKRFDKYILYGEPMMLSSWWLMIQRRLFYRKKKVFIWTHGWYGREGFVKKWMKRAFFGMADHVFTYGEFARQQAIKQGFNPAKITPIHNSLDYEQQKKIREELKESDIYKNHFGNENPTLLFVGRLTKVKRLDMLIEAQKLLEEEKVSVNLVFIGAGEEMDNLKNIVSKEGLQNRVWFYGACYDDTKIAELIYNADLCVAPGNVGLTAMHAMAFGTPVLTHNDFYWQMPEYEAIVPGITGNFFEYENVKSMTEAIKQWLKDHAGQREEVRKACYEEIEKNWSPEFQMEILRKFL